MYLKWQLALLSMRARRSNRNQESRPRNQDNLRKPVNMEDTSSKAMVAIDGVDYEMVGLKENMSGVNYLTKAHELQLKVEAEAPLGPLSLSGASAGTCGFWGTRRGTPFAAQTAAGNAIRTVVEQGATEPEDRSTILLLMSSPFVPSLLNIPTILYPIPGWIMKDFVLKYR
nr:ribosomal protein S11, chloroplastic [Tanacetum cinerariifolium]